MGTNLRGALLVAAVLVASSIGCTSILGDFNSNGSSSGGHDGGGPDAITGGGGGDAGDASPDAMAMSDDASPDVVEVTDGGMEGEAAPPPPPPPPPGKPGFDLTSGGNVSTSTHYKLVGALGEAPGGYTLSTSTTYKFRGGVVAETQNP
jgi:hypothetical protein